MSREHFSILLSAILVLWALRRLFIGIGFGAAIYLQRTGIVLGLHIHRTEWAASYDELERGRLLGFTSITIGLWPLLFTITTPIRYGKPFGDKPAEQ